MKRGTTIDFKGILLKIGNIKIDKTFVCLIKIVKVGKLEPTKSARTLQKCKFSLKINNYRSHNRNHSRKGSLYHTEELILPISIKILTLEMGSTKQQFLENIILLIFSLIIKWNLKAR